MALESLGISSEIMIIGLIALAIVLLLLIVFIFSGIKAFALGGTFGSVINSLIAICKTISEIGIVKYIYTIHALKLNIFNLIGSGIGAAN